MNDFFIDGSEFILFLDFDDRYEYLQIILTGFLDYFFAFTLSTIE